MKRRQLIALLAAKAPPVGLAQPQHSTPRERRNEPGRRASGFLTRTERPLIEALVEMIVPADAHSPGAGQARVADYIDLVLSHSDSKVRESFRTEMAAFFALSPQPFLQLPPDKRTAILDRAAAPEAAATGAGKFFARLRELTLAGYYTSHIGLRRELGYQGGAVLGKFPGCETGAPSAGGPA